MQVLDPGPPPAYNVGARRLRRNGKLQVSTRSITCPWQEWVQRAAELKAEREANAAEIQSMDEDLARRRADRIAVEASRRLPEAYDEDRFDAAFDQNEDVAQREALTKAYIRARRLGQYASARAIEPLLLDLPVPVLRDILAADQYGIPGAAGTVAATFVRAAELLEMARIGMLEQSSGYDTRSPGKVITETDASFVRAVLARVAADGGRLLLPSVPQLPEWVEQGRREIASMFGWLRVTVADSSGVKLHAAGCRSVHTVPVLECAHLPWWSVLLKDDHVICARCEGPGLRDLVAFAGFAAAADVWKARGCNRIENWQQQALQRLIVTTAAARAQIPEPDITLTYSAVSALAANPPGAEGWAAYALGTAAPGHRLARTAQDLPPAMRKAALAVLHERIGILESVLAEPRPFPHLEPHAGVEELRERYTQLKEFLGGRVPQLDRLMFTPPRASRSV